MIDPDHRLVLFPQALSPTSHSEVAEIFGQVLKRDVRAEREEPGDWRLRATGLSEYALENLVKMFEYYDRWGLAGNPNVLKWILNREPTSLKQFMERISKDGNFIPRG